MSPLFGPSSLPFIPFDAPFLSRPAPWRSLLSAFVVLFSAGFVCVFARARVSVCVFCLRCLKSHSAQMLMYRSKENLNVVGLILGGFFKVKM